MAMARGREKKFFPCLLGTYTTELKVLITTLLLLCSVAILLRFTISASDLRFCITTVPQTTTTLPSVSLSQPSPPVASVEEVLPNGIIKRAFNPYGSAAYNFITMGAYRGGLNTFVIIGLASKVLHIYSNPTYECEWISNGQQTKPVTTGGYTILTDWGYGRVYTAVIVNCTFPAPLNENNSGGKLIFYASTSGGGDTKFNTTDRMEVLTEQPGKLDVSVFNSKPKYDYFYCGSPLFGNMNPQRVREWIAYHVKFFGPNSHFVLYDAGGVHEGVYEVLKPWIDLGYVTLHDIRGQERFDGYYHNQFIVLNDCLHRYKFMGKWMFFFDVDEYIYVPPKSTIKTVLDSLKEYTQFTIRQIPMSAKLCLSADYGKTHRKWGFEKLVYKDVKKGIRRDRKSVVQPRSIFATGVHMSLDLDGKTTHRTEGKIKYFHYRGTITERRESCKVLLNTSETTYEKTPYALDTTMRDIARVIKKFELKMIGNNRVQKTSR